MKDFDKTTHFAGEFTFDQSYKNADEREKLCKQLEKELHPLLKTPKPLPGNPLSD